MINTQYITLDMKPSGVLPVLYCSQYDIGRPLGMVVYNSGEVVDLDDYTVTIEATRTDGVAITALVTTSGNIGAFETTATMTNKANRYGAQLVLSAFGKRVASLPFVMCVVKAAMDENSESIEEDKSLYQQYTETVAELIDEIRADVEALQEDVEKLKEKPFYIVTDYGIYPDSGDVYSDLFDFLRDVVAPTGGTVFFPAGRYTLSYTIVIPPNTSFVGAGRETEIYFNEQDTTFGVALTNGGANVVIDNMTVNSVSSAPYATNVALAGSIGLSDVDFSKVTTKYQHDFSEARKSGNNNIRVSNLWVDSNYALQIETSVNAMNNIIFENIVAPKAMVSVQPNVANLINNVFMDNIECDCLRLGTSATRYANGIQCNNIVAHQILVRLNNVTLNNVFLDDRTTGNHTTDPDAAIIFSSTNLLLNNVHGISDDPARSIFIYNVRVAVTGRYIFLNNVVCEGYSRKLSNFNANVMRIGSNHNLGDLYSDVTPTLATGYSNIDTVFHMSGNYLEYTSMLILGSGTTIATLSNYSDLGFPTRYGIGYLFCSNTNTSQIIPVRIKIETDGTVKYEALKSGYDGTYLNRISFQVFGTII